MAQACTLVHTCASGTPTKASVSDMRFQFTVEKATRAFEPGEMIEGTLSIWEIPWNMEGICALRVVLEGRYMSSSGQNTKVIEAQKLIVGSAHSVTALELKEYKLAIQVPKDCPPSFVSNENGGRLRYSVRCVAHGLRGVWPLRQERLIQVMSQCVSSWANQEALCEPVVTDHEITVDASTGIHLSLKTNHQCYAPGDLVEFSLKVKNSSKKNIRRVKICLVQLVRLKLTKTADRNHICGVNNGPPVDSGSAHVWSGSLEIPGPLPPSEGQSGSNSETSIAFKYKLEVTLQIGGFFGTVLLETFPIEIAPPIMPGLATPSAPLLQKFEPLQMTTGDFQGQRQRSRSVVSLTPSLPDYRTALIRGVLPPAYSTLDILRSQESEED